MTAEDERPSSANYHANALVRGLALLERMAAGPEPLTLNDLLETTGVPKSTLVRLLSVLCELEYAVRVDDRPRYRLGHKVQHLAKAYVSALDLSEVAGRYLEPLAKSTQQTANLGVLDGDQVLHICVCEPDRPLRFTAEPGTRDHAYCTGLGKLLLAYADPDELQLRTPPEPFPAFTPHTMTTREALARDLRRTRRRGWALDDNERSTGLRCVAAPILIAEQALAAVSVSGPSAEFSATQQARYVEQLGEVAAALVADSDFDAALRIVHRSLRPLGLRAESAPRP
jgi:DNA-binding IclR family transcriptional regulator